MDELKSNEQLSKKLSIPDFALKTQRQIEKDLTALTAEQLIASNSNLPVIFEINWKAGKLIPTITSLTFAEQRIELDLPSFPEESQGRQFFYKLISELELVLVDIHPNHNQVLLYEN